MGFATGNFCACVCVWVCFARMPVSLEGLVLGNYELGRFKRGGGVNKGPGHKYHCGLVSIWRLIFIPVSIGDLSAAEFVSASRDVSWRDTLQSKLSHGSTGRSLFDSKLKYPSRTAIERRAKSLGSIDGAKKKSSQALANGKSDGKIINSFKYQTHSATFIPFFDYQNWY